MQPRFDQTVILNVLTFSNLNSRLDSFQKKRGELRQQPIHSFQQKRGNESEYWPLLLTSNVYIFFREIYVMCLFPNSRGFVSLEFVSIILWQFC